VKKKEKRKMKWMDADGYYLTEAEFLAYWDATSFSLQGGKKGMEEKPKNKEDSENPPQKKKNSLIFSDPLFSGSMFDP
jgi:hypothetical protein